MLAVEERGLLGAQKKLRPVGIWPSAAASTRRLQSKDSETVATQAFANR